MNIYEMKNKDLKKLLISFSKTTYGSIVFLTSYCVPFFAFIFLIVGVITNIFTFLTMTITFLVILSSFLVGNAFYYTQVKEYSFYLSHKQEKEKTNEEK